jgi:hypothetical protein
VYAGVCTDLTLAEVHGSSLIQAIRDKGEIDNFAEGLKTEFHIPNPIRALDSTKNCSEVAAMVEKKLALNK